MLGVAVPEVDLAVATLSDLAQRRPEVVALARVASVAAVVEPALLRRLRLEVPGLAPAGTALHAGTEADLWFSRLAHVATAGQFTLAPAIAETLRRQLGEPQHQAVARAARRIVQDTHAQHPDMVRLEERVIWSTIIGDPADVGRALDRALAAIRLGPERAAEVVRWAMQARRRLPPSALNHPAGRRLLAAVALHTDRVVPAELLTAGRFPDAVGDLAPTGLPLTTVGAELVEGGIRFVPDGQPTAATVTLPDTRPLVLEARWQDRDETPHSAVIAAQPGTATALPGLAGPVVLRTLAGQRFRLSTVQARQVVIAAFGESASMELDPVSIAAVANGAEGRVGPDITVRIDHEPVDIYSSKPEVLIAGPGQPAVPGFDDFAAAFVRAAVRARGADGYRPGVVIGVRRPDEAPGAWYYAAGEAGLQMFDVHDLSADTGALIGPAVRAAAEANGRMYELDPDSALAMMQSLALAFHVGAFYAEEVGPGGERSLFDLGDELAYELFNFVRGQCEWLFAGPTRGYLEGSDDPAQRIMDRQPRDPRQPVLSAFPEFLTWFVRQFHHYAELMRDRLGPRQIVNRYPVSPDVLEACRLALGTVGLPLGQDQVSQSQTGNVSYAVERARLPGLISALAEPVLEAVAVAAAGRAAPSGRNFLPAAAGAPVTSVAFFPDGKLLATAGHEPLARVWNVGTRHQVAHTGRYTDDVSAVAVAPDGSWLATGSGLTVGIWDMATGEQRTLSGLGDRVSALAVAPDGTWLATADRNGLLRTYDTYGWAPRLAMDLGIGGLSALAVAPDGTWLAVGGDGGEVRILDPATGAPRLARAVPRGATALAVAPDGSWLAVGGSDGAVEFWGISGEREGIFVAGRQGPVNPVAAGYTADGRILLATSSDGNSVRIWNPADGTLITEFTGHTGPVNALAFSPGALLLASASDDGTVRLWDVSAGTPPLP